MSDQILNKVIRISGEEKTVTATGKVKLRIKDENNRGYTVWQNKADGSETAAFQAYKNFKLGDTVEIGYKEESYVNKEGQPAKSSTILTMKPAQPQLATPTPTYGAKPAVKQEFDDTRASIERQVAFKAAIELVVAGKVELKDVPAKTNEFADLIAGKLPSRQAAEAPANEDIATIQLDEVGEDVDPSDFMSN